MKMTERQLQLALWDKLFKGMQLMVPNFTPKDWFECDVWGVSLAGLVWEFEIKVAFSDFRKDASKAPGSRFSSRSWSLRSNMDPKYVRLASGDYHGPSNFVYVAPKGVIPPEEVPEWAGLWEYEPVGGLVKVLKSRRLHRCGVESAELERAKTCLYYRYWNLLHEQSKRYPVPENCGRE